MVLDLQDAFAVDEVKRAIEKFETVQESDIDSAHLADLLASIRGVTLGISFRERAFGRLKIDFGEDAALLNEIAKPLVLEILGAYGVMIDEVAEWKPEVKGKTLFFWHCHTESAASRQASSAPSALASRKKGQGRRRHSAEACRFCETALNLLSK